MKNDGDEEVSLSLPVLARLFADVKQGNPEREKNFNLIINLGSPSDINFLWRVFSLVSSDGKLRETLLRMILRAAKTVRECWQVWAKVMAESTLETEVLTKMVGLAKNQSTLLRIRDYTIIGGKSRRIVEKRLVEVERELAESTAPLLV